MVKVLNCQYFYVTKVIDIDANKCYKNGAKTEIGKVAEKYTKMVNSDRS